MFLQNQCLLKFKEYRAFSNKDRPGSCGHLGPMKIMERFIPYTKRKYKLKNLQKLLPCSQSDPATIYLQIKQCHFLNQL